MKATAKAPANIAFIKYWGKADDTLRLPLNDSISMNMSGAYTITTVEFSKQFKKDSVTLVGGEFSEEETARVIKGLDLIRKRAGSTQKQLSSRKIHFPKGRGRLHPLPGLQPLPWQDLPRLE